MQKKCLIIILLLITLNHFGFAQSNEITATVFTENFNDNSNQWRIYDTKEYQTYISTSGKYVCNHPVDQNLGFTRMPIPDVLNSINDGENASLAFEVQVLKARSDGYFSFGLIFDWHQSDNVDCITKERNGGDFYLLHVSGDVKKGYAFGHILQRQNCNEKVIIGSKYAIPFQPESNIKVEIKRNGGNYEIILNNTSVVSFVYDARCRFSDLYFERGEYAFDNFKINTIKYSFANLSGFVPTNEVSKKPNIYVLLAGINHYTNPNYPQQELTGPLKDVESLKRFYNSVKGGALSNANIVLLPESQATADNILNAATDLFAKANQNDVIITYFSGHGGMGYFCAYDQGLQYERINLILNKSPAKKLFIVDACRSGSWDVSSALTSKGDKLTKEQALDLFYKQLSNSGNGINWLLACRPDEYSADGNNNGLFTEFMLEGLNGKADKEGNNDNIVSLDELYIYLKGQFSQWNAKHSGQIWPESDVPVRMNPVLKSSGNTNIPVAVVYNEN